MKEELKNQLEALLSDDSVFDEIQKVSSIEEFTSLLAQKGITLSDDDLQELLTQAQGSEEGELSEDALEDVAGGSLLSRIKWVLRNLTTIGGPIRPLLR